ncbi:hypothetical protein [Nocardia sp. CA-290969]|uniref:hypothetical protein n=1 Tax=Nocardia sp. CA-290969 TaxID=3239986 RepID=UPI003D9441E8
MRTPVPQSGLARWMLLHGPGSMSVRAVHVQDADAVPDHEMPGPAPPALDISAYVT